MEKILKHASISYIDKVLLDKDGLINVLTIDELKKIDSNDLRLWCHFNGVYMIPTKELVDFLKDQIGEKTALEIGAGNGVLGRALGIPMVDNFMQRDFPEVKAYYESIKQPIVKYGADVEQMNANIAVDHMKPQVVVGSWITHVWKVEDHKRGGNAYGIDEVEIIKKVDKYIHIGDKKVHANKRALELDHKTYPLAGAFGRGSEKTIWIWSKYE